MNTLFRNVLAIILGIILGSLVNMAIVTMSSSIIPPPTDADITTMEGLKASLHLFEPKHFLMPFLAHALGTFVGAAIAGMVSGSYKMRFAMAIGFFFLIGGIANVILLPSPTWFTVLDLGLAYLPMSYLAGKLVIKKQ